MTDLDRLFEKAGIATPGPWRRNGPIIESEAERWVVLHVDRGVQLSADADYIAAASPDVVRGLIERVKLAEARVKEAERAQRILSERGNHVSECLVLHFEKEKAEARLRAAEEVVEAARRFRHPKPYDACPICVALSHYDEAVKK